ncbi:PREDICTED: uncharacterized protein LOC108445713 isoform X1 [Corvus brachyrhynchos]|uniref:uncharacterized protein LOC108445713 isoform X1 n=1 Tax=Corvus brachyrhynchos TaxID=85066 RepID=UPI0008166E19|nr:PREDICTED: uncharacterized protein LOC108445713 isoform X1 [Corvus brachyrhynchos]XP_031960343.1 uncharacterized protein LOC116441941 isoform X1 [Corvus moneduloides]XP_041900968.1 uncharacterized protein LOC121672398 isoform X1 [Corvus kubaryi]XP_041900976.1 uncharacterized protein LOC121672401 isoform X1 [Corvus kubaryi]
MPGTSALHLRCPRRPSEGTWRERLQVSTEQSQDQLRLVQSTLRPRAECSGTVPSLQTNARPTWTRGCPSRPWSSPLPASPVALCGQLSNKTETGTVGEITLSQGGFCSQGLLRISHQLQLPVFRSRAIRQSDTRVQPNSHLLQSQEHNVQMKRWKIAWTSLACRARLFICLLRMEVLTLGAFCNMRKVLFRVYDVLASQQRSSKRQALTLLPALHD